MKHREDDDNEEGQMWREFGLRRALASMPKDSPGRPVVEALLARGSLTPEEQRRFKIRGLSTALESMPADSPGREVVEVDTDSGSTRTVLADYQANGRDLYEVARTHAILYDLVVAP